MSPVQPDAAEELLQGNGRKCPTLKYLVFQACGMLFRKAVIAARSINTELENTNVLHVVHSF